MTVYVEIKHKSVKININYGLDGKMELAGEDTFSSLKGAIWPLTAVSFTAKLFLETLFTTRMDGPWILNRKY